MRTYRVDVQRGRSGRWWLLDVPAVTGAHSQARRLDQVEEVARDLIALMDDDAPAEYALDVHVHLSHEIREELERSEELRQQAAHTQSEAARLARDAARRLAEQGLPLRDVGSVLGVSFQRAKQLVDEGKRLVDA